MKQESTIVFVCEHGAAKSSLAAAYFNRLAEELGLDVRAVARGTDPDHEISEQTLQGLTEDEMTPTESTPRKISLDDVQSAQRIVSFCELPREYMQNVLIDQWEDIPAVNKNYDKARGVIVERIRQMLDHVK